jgi:hypothetical protein
MIHPDVETIWNMLYPDEQWIPDNWIDLEYRLEQLQTPNVIDLLRIR